MVNKVGEKYNFSSINVFLSRNINNIYEIGQIKIRSRCYLFADEF